MQRKVLTIFIIALLVAVTMSTSGCYFFRKRGTGKSSGSDGSNFYSRMGVKAGGMNEELLAGVHDIETSHAPASVRPDPDIMVRQLLLQYRSPGATLAREIGRVEQYRLLLGGASEDFVKEPSLTYDATSLLANLKVAEEICEGLVSPNESQHPGWSSILPDDPSNTDANIRFLSQRLLGIPSKDVDSSMVTSLQGILDTAKESGSYTRQSYIPVCATLLIDAQALLF